MKNLDHGAAYLAAKPLGDGLAKLGLPTDPLPPRPVREMRPANDQQD